MKYYKKIEGKNIYLSPINLLDADIYAKWLNDRNITDNLGNTVFVTNEEKEKEWILSKTSEVRFAIIKKDGDELIGNCSLMDINRINRTATLGIFIGEKDNQAKGYGFEAINLLLEYGFNISNFHNINLKVFEFNKKAISCYKKCGFRECGRRSESYFINGKYYDELEMEILEDTYRNKKNTVEC